MKNLFYIALALFSVSSLNAVKIINNSSQSPHLVGFKTISGKEAPDSIQLHPNTTYENGDISSVVIRFASFLTYTIKDLKSDSIIKLEVIDGHGIISKTDIIPQDSEY